MSSLAHQLEGFAVEEDTQQVVIWSASQRFVIVTHADMVRMMNAFDLSISVVRQSPAEVREALRDLSEAVPIIDYSLQLVH